MKDSPQKHSLVLGEGGEDVAVLKKIAPESISNRIKYENYGGTQKLKEYLETKLKSSDYTKGYIKKILVTRDADEDWRDAWQAIVKIVKDVLKVKVSEPGEWQPIKNGSLITIWIVPGVRKHGMIETLCLEAAKDSNPGTFECLNGYINCLENQNQIELHEKERFAIWTIAAQGSSPKKRRQRRLSFPKAIKRLPLDWDSDVFSEIKALLAKTSEF